MEDLKITIKPSAVSYRFEALLIIDYQESNTHYEVRIESPEYKKLDLEHQKEVYERFIKIDLMLAILEFPKFVTKHKQLNNEEWQKKVEEKIRLMKTQLEGATK